MFRNKVLFVDDEANILNSIYRCVMDEQFDALFADSGEKALQMFEEHKISVIVSDMKMPNMNGLQLLKRVKEISPTTVRVVLSGYTQLPQILATVNSVGVFRYVTKPWNDEEELLPAIRDSVEYYNLALESVVLREELESQNKLYEKSIELNKNLLKQVSSSLNNIKSVSTFMLRIQNTYLDNLKDNTDNIHKSSEYNKVIGDLYVNYLGKSLVDKEKFELSRFKTDIIKASDKAIHVKVSDEEYFHIGDYKFIKFVTTESIKFLLNLFDLKYLMIEINHNPKLHIRIKHEHIDFYNSYINNIEMKLFFSMIYQLLSTIEGSVKFNSNNVNEVILIFEGKE